MAKRKRNKKTEKSAAALRREVEALKAQLKEHGIESEGESPLLQKEKRVDYQKISRSKTISIPDESEQRSQKPIANDSSYLKGEVIKTTAISFFIVAVIVAIKIFNII